MPFALDLPVIFAFIIAFAIYAYVMMDGFDLGIGILFPMIPAGRERDTAMNSIAPCMGRQRDLAGAGRRWPAGGLSVGLRRDLLGALRADHRHAAGPGVPRRRLRVPLA